MIAALVLAIAAMIVTAQATRRERAPRRRLRHAARLAGIALFVASLAAAIGDGGVGVGIGIVAWLMILSVGALVAVALITLRRPQR